MALAHFLEEREVLDISSANLKHVSVIFYKAHICCIHDFSDNWHTSKVTGKGQYFETFLSQSLKAVRTGSGFERPTSQHNRSGLFDGISASLNAKKHNLKALILEQDTLGGTVFTFPRSKIVMTSPMDLPLHGKVKFFQTSKGELLDLWKKLIQKNDIKIKENSKVEAIIPENNIFKIVTLSGEEFTSKKVLLSIGRRGTPRKLNIPGENLENVAYRLLEPEAIKDKNIIVVGGGDSAIESALLLAEQNKVILSYRGEAFNRIKPDNNRRITDAIKNGIVEVRLNTSPTSIRIEEVVLLNSVENNETKIKNDLVYIFAGGELPSQFLQKIGINITKKFGEAILKH